MRWCKLRSVGKSADPNSRGVDSSWERRQGRGAAHVRAPSRRRPPASGAVLRHEREGRRLGLVAAEEEDGAEEDRAHGTVGAKHRHRARQPYPLHPYGGDERPSGGAQALEQAEGAQDGRLPEPGDLARGDDGHEGELRGDAHGLPDPEPTTPTSTQAGVAVKRIGSMATPQTTPPAQTRTPCALSLSEAWAKAGPSRKAAIP